MNKLNAQIALAIGASLTHTYFDEHESIHLEGVMMVMEDGAAIDQEVFWKDGQGFVTSKTTDQDLG